MGRANRSRAVKLRTILLVVCVGLAMSIAGCLPMSVRNATSRPAV
jgi:hypothetical protein